MIPSAKGDPEQSPRRGGRIITPERATIIAALIAFIGTIAAILLTNVLATKSPEPTPHTASTIASPTADTSDGLSKLELVDVSTEERGGEVVFLDVKIRNTGNKTSVLKRAIAHVSDWRTIDPCLPGAALPVSSTYKMTFPESPKKSRFDISTEMHDSLNPNEATRVRIEAGLDTESPNIDGVIFRFTLELHFDAKASVRSDTILISLPRELSPPSHWENLRKDPEARECAEVNLKNLRIMLGLPGRRSKDLQEITDAL
ncbi:hypothetical protein [Streptomyces xantholiticus]|uniref:DUF4352 domain-containing protein n=1 Tax=Streptomyces xantholiticus TaxID=68285 RepID=A0ABV1V4S5_9ACTN